MNRVNLNLKNLPSNYLEASYQVIQEFVKPKKKTLFDNEAVQILFSEYFSLRFLSI